MANITITDTLFDGRLSGDFGDDFKEAIVALMNSEHIYTDAIFVVKDGDEGCLTAVEHHRSVANLDEDAPTLVTLDIAQGVAIGVLELTLITILDT